MLGVIKDNLERETDEYEEVEPGLAKFSATRWTERAVCFKRIFKNYQVLQETWKECLKQGGLRAEIKARVLGCPAQINSFNFLIIYLVFFLEKGCLPTLIICLLLYQRKIFLLYLGKVWLTKLWKH